VPSTRGIARQTALKRFAEPNHRLLGNTCALCVQCYAAKGLIEFIVTIRFCMCLADEDVQVAILSAGASDVRSVLRG